MNRSRWVWTLGLGALTMLACSSDVWGPAADKGTDEDCYDSCVAKGESPDLCSSYCSADSKSCYDDCVAKGVPPTDCTAVCAAWEGGTKPGVGGTAGSGASSGIGGSSSSPIDPELEKTCVECWYDVSQTGEACEDEAKACDQSLACTQLQWCPLICAKPDCWQECNEVIPTGVAPLTALVQCVACDDGPCAEECQDSVMLGYCN